LFIFNEDVAIVNKTGKIQWVFDVLWRSAAHAHCALSSKCKLWL